MPFESPSAASEQTLRQAFALSESRISAPRFAAGYQAAIHFLAETITEQLSATALIAPGFKKTLIRVLKEINYDLLVPEDGGDVIVRMRPENFAMPEVEFIGPQTGTVIIHRNDKGKTCLPHPDVDILFPVKLQQLSRYGFVGARLLAALNDAPELVESKSVATEQSLMPLVSALIGKKKQFDLEKERLELLRLKNEAKSECHKAKKRRKHARRMPENELAEIRQLAAALKSQRQVAAQQRQKAKYDADIALKNSAKAKAKTKKMEKDKSEKPPLTSSSSSANLLISFIELGVVWSSSLLSTITYAALAIPTAFLPREKPVEVASPNIEIESEPPPLPHVTQEDPRKIATYMSLLAALYEVQERCTNERIQRKKDVQREANLRYQAGVAHGNKIFLPQGASASPAIVREPLRNAGHKSTPLSRPVLSSRRATNSNIAAP